MFSFFLLQNYLTLLDDEDHRLEYLKIQDEQHLVIEGIKSIIDCTSKNKRFTEGTYGEVMAKLI